MEINVKNKTPQIHYHRLELHPINHLKTPWKQKKTIPDKFQSKDKNYFSQIPLYLPQKTPLIIELN